MQNLNTEFSIFGESTFYLGYIGKTARSLVLGLHNILSGITNSSMGQEYKSTVIAFLLFTLVISIFGIVTESQNSMYHELLRKGSDYEKDTKNIIYVVQNALRILFIVVPIIAVVLEVVNIKETHSPDNESKKISLFPFSILALIVTAIIVYPFMHFSKKYIPTALDKCNIPPYVRLIILIIAILIYCIWEVINIIKAKNRTPMEIAYGIVLGVLGLTCIIYPLIWVSRLRIGESDAVPDEMKNYPRMRDKPEGYTGKWYGASGKHGASNSKTN